MNWDKLKILAVILFGLWELFLMIVGAVVVIKWVWLKFPTS